VKLAAVALATVAVAANPKDPQKRHTAADMRTAHAIALRLSDLPAGWKQVRSDNSSDTCAAQPDESQFVETADVDPTFDSPAGDVVELDSEVQTFATAAQARRDWGWATEAAMRSCAQEQIGRAVGGRAKVVLTAFSPPQAAVEREKGFRMTIDATVQGRRIVATGALIALGQGRTTVFLTTFTLRGYTVQPSVTRKLVSVLTQRLVAHA
jgi:hypothetical protein